MKARTHIPAVARGIALLCIVVFVASTPSTARAAGVVGSGTAASCTEAALSGALAGAGLVTFKCGGAATITVTTTKTVTADTTIEGGSQITISGGNSVGVFHVIRTTVTPTFTVQNLTIANGKGADGSIGGIYNAGGTLTVTNIAFSGNSANDGGAIFNNGTDQIRPTQAGCSG